MKPEEVTVDQNQETANASNLVTPHTCVVCHDRYNMSWNSVEELVTEAPKYLYVCPDCQDKFISTI